MSHRTKDKGDLGLGQVICDLMSSGCKVCLPMSDHLPFDLIAVSDLGKLCRIQVKYKTKDNGIVTVNLRRQIGGGRMAPFDHTSIDALAIYVPDTGHVYYMRCDELVNNHKFVALRIDPPMKNRTRGSRVVRMANDYRGSARIW